MAFVVTLVVGFCGGAIAALLHAPIPWLLGSLLVTALLTAGGLTLVRLPSAHEQWMRVLIGVALGPSVANSLSGLEATTSVAVVGSLVSVLLLAALGYTFFQRWLHMSRGEAFLSALPGGLSFMMALADRLQVADKSSRSEKQRVSYVKQGEVEA